MRDVGEIMTTTLNAFTMKLTETPKFPLPRQRFIQAGDLSPDCELLAVQAGGFYQGLPGQQRPGYQVESGGIAMYAIDINVTVLRIAPTASNGGVAPAANILTKASLQATADAKALADAYWASVNDGSLASICDNLYFGGVHWEGPQGGILATILTFSTQI